MTPKQSDLLFYLGVTNVILWGGLGFWIYGMPAIVERYNAQATTAAFQRTQVAANPTVAAKPTPTFTPALVRASRPSIPNPNQKSSAPIMGATAALIAPQAVATAPSGDNPSNPASVANTWQALSPGASVWVKLGSGGDHIDAFLEANPIDGVTMQVFSPDNLERPIGQGTYQSSSGRLGWAGGKWNSTGAWMAKITNGNSGVVQYKLTATAAPIPPCDSISYWEKIGTADVYWTRCK